MKPPPRLVRRASPAVVLCLVPLATALPAAGQQDVIWHHEAGTGLWWHEDNKPWHYTGWNSREGRPDIWPVGTRNHVKFGNNTQTTMTVNGAWFALDSLELQAAATAARTFTASDGGGISLSSGIFNHSGATHAFHAPIGVDGATVQFQANSGGLEFSREIYLNANQAAFSGSGSILATGTLSGAGGSVGKSGTGVLTLSGTNTYTGATTVSAGTLVIDGDHSAATGTVTVAGGAVLGGSGTIGGAVEVAGTHAPGNSPGIQTVNGNLSYSSGSIFAWDLASLTDAPGDRGSAYDGVNGGGGALGVDAGSVFRIVLGVPFDGEDSFWKTGQRSWSVFQGFGSGSGTFGGFELVDSASGGNPLDFASAGSFSFDAGSGNLTWSAVPEPGSLLAGLVLAAGLLRRRR